ncbi:MAG: MFS transporter [Vicinamibacterales bacterium]|nr:MFS transporter [Vicinamibacterales bacterium]
MARLSRLFGNRPRLPRPVWLVSWTSFFTDTASEAIYPIMPLYLTRTLGGTAMAIGIIEGAAEALNSVLKILSGRLSDRWSARKPFVMAGYGISTLARPLVALATSWLHVLAVRLTDRVGKGIRAAPRDALLASWADPATRGYVFGLHRAMDHAGAIVGPLLASLFLWFFPEQYRTLFALTLIPGLMAVAMLVPVPDAPAPREAAAPAPSGPAAPLGRRFSGYLGVLFLFSLGNSTDAFLLLRLSDVGVGVAWIPVAWAALHVVKALVSPIAGHLSDGMSRRGIIATGWLLYAGVYGGFALASSAATLVPLFLLYGVYYGLTEGVEKAVVADLAPAGRRGAAFGAYHAVIGIGALAASLVFAGIWKAAGAPAAFALGAALALASSVSLFRLDLSPIMKSSHEENPRHQ